LKGYKSVITLIVAAHDCLGGLQRLPSLTNAMIGNGGVVRILLGHPNLMLSFPSPCLTTQKHHARTNKMDAKFQ